MRSITLVLALLLSAPAAAGPRAVRLRVSGELPISSAALERAVGARLRLSPRDPAALPVKVEGRGGGLVLITAGDRQLELRLLDGTPAVGARLVAVAIAGLLLDEVTPGLLPPERPRWRLPPVRLGLRSSAAGGMADRESYGVHVALEAALELRFVVVALDVAWWRAFPDHEYGGADSITFNAMVLRGECGLRLGPLELRAGPFLAPYQVDTARQASGVLGGAGLGLRGLLPLGSRLGLYVGGGVDVFFKRIEVVSIGSVSLATPTLGWWLGLGLTWRITS